MKQRKLIKCVPELDWEFEEIVSLNGGIGNKYYFKKLQAIKIQLDGGVATKLSGYTLINHDLSMILVWLQTLLDEYTKLGLDIVNQNTIHITPEYLRPEFDKIKALIVAAFSFYGKLFTKADGRKIKLEINIFNKNQELISIHNEIMLYRHNFSAHSGKEMVEYVEVALLLDSDQSRNTRPFLVRTMNQPNAFSIKFLSDFKKVCNYLIQKIDLKIDSFIKDYYKNLTPERIKMMYKIHTSK